MLKQRILDGELLSGRHVWALGLAEGFDVCDNTINAYSKKLLKPWYQRLDHQTQNI